MKNLSYSNGDIDRLGNKVRKEYPDISDNTLLELQEYRTSYEEIISDIFSQLLKETKSVSKNAIVTYRIKRFESIIGKLARIPEMRFSRMGDIGGCRCILNNYPEVYKLRAKIEKSFIIKKETDYIKQAKKDGYKSLHLLVSLHNDSRIIEIQLRSVNDHNWATLVEISDLLYDFRLKEHNQPEEMVNFHFLLSKRENLSYEENCQLASTINKYKYFSKLSEVFARNYLEVRKQWVRIESKERHKYFLIVASKDKIPQIKSFESVSKAEKEYFELYKSSKNANIVLTHLPKPSYKQISIAYSNYILTFHSFHDECRKIFETIIAQCLQQSHYIQFIKYYKIYSTILVNDIKNLVDEVLTVKEINSKKDLNPKDIQLNSKINQWNVDIKNLITSKKKQGSRAHVLFRQHMPKSSMSKIIIKSIVRYINYRSKKKLQKIIPK